MAPKLWMKKYKLIILAWIYVSITSAQAEISHFYSHFPKKTSWICQYLDWLTRDAVYVSNTTMVRVILTIRFIIKLTITIQIFTLNSYVNINKYLVITIQSFMLTIRNQIAFMINKIADITLPSTML